MLAAKRAVRVERWSLVDAGCDIVVNASNASATLGGGVSRALFVECGGLVLQDEMKQKLEDDFDGVLDEDDCLVTSAGTSMKFRHVLHVAAVDYRGTRARLGASGIEKTVTSPERIQACTEAALRAASELASTKKPPSRLPFRSSGPGLAVCLSPLSATP